MCRYDFDEFLIHRTTEKAGLLTGDNSYWQKQRLREPEERSRYSA